MILATKENHIDLKGHRTLYLASGIPWQITSLTDLLHSANFILKIYPDNMRKI